VTWQSSPKFLTELLQRSSIRHKSAPSRLPAGTNPVSLVQLFKFFVGLGLDLTGFYSGQRIEFVASSPAVILSGDTRVSKQNDNLQAWCESNPDMLIEDFNYTQSFSRHTKLGYSR